MKKPKYRVECPTVAGPIYAVELYADDPGEAALLAANAFTGCDILADVDRKVALEIIESLVVIPLSSVHHWPDALRHITDREDADRNQAARAAQLSDDPS